jgi:hypothetical protein
VASLAFDRTAKLLVAGWGSLGPPTIWDVDTGDVVRTVMSPSAGMVCLRPAFSPDGTVMACAGAESKGDGAPVDAVTMRFWDARSGQPLGPPLVAYLRLDHDLFSLTFSSDSKILTTVAWGSGVLPFIRWDIRTPSAVGAPFGPVLAPGDAVVGISPDFRQIVSENAADQSLSLRDASSGLSAGPRLRSGQRAVLGAGPCVRVRRLGSRSSLGEECRQRRRHTVRFHR